MGEVGSADVAKASLFTPCLDLVIGEAKPVMGVVCAKFFKSVIGEVNNYEATAGAKGPADFSYCGCRIIEEVEYVMQNRYVHRPSAQGKVINVSVANCAVAMAEVIKATTG